MWYLLYRQRIGRYILAVGGNANAAELSGISIARTVISAHAISGLLAALAGIRWSRACNSVSHRSATIVDPFVRRSRHRGAALSGGHVSVFGTLSAS